jgi:hypothetical protein
MRRLPWIALALAVVAVVVLGRELINTPVGGSPESDMEP